MSSDLLRLAEMRERATATGNWRAYDSAAADYLTPARLRQLAAMEEALQRIRDWPENSASGCVQIAREALITKGPTNE